MSANIRVMEKTNKYGKLHCMQITSVVLPAVRASVASKLYDMGYGQESIADELGIAQAAVSKYMNKRYSSEVALIKKQIDEQKLYEGIIDIISKKKGKHAVSESIKLLCERMVETGMLD
jgi:predicted transcriptional regulator